jgi:hypothetical protein
MVDVIQIKLVFTFYLKKIIFFFINYLRFKTHEIQITVQLEDIIISKSIYSLQDFWCYLFERRVYLSCSDAMQYNRNRISQKGKKYRILNYTKLTILYVNML